MTNQTEAILQKMRDNVKAVSMLNLMENEPHGEITISLNHYIEIGQLIKALQSEVTKNRQPENQSLTK